MQVQTGIHAGQGLGDLVADITHLTGIDQLAQLYEQFTGKSCGCDERKRKLNMLFPFGTTT